MGAGVLLISTGLDDIVDLENHLGDLSCEEQLLALAGQCFEDPLLPHVVGAHVIAVDTQVRVLLLNLHRMK